MKDQELEEKLKEKYHEQLNGQKIYLSMNNGNTYSGTVVLWQPITDSIILKDVDILGTGINLKDVKLYFKNLSARWTEDSYKSYKEERKN